MDGATQKEKVRLVAALAVVGRKMHRPRKSKTKKSKTQTKKPHDAKRLPQLAASFIYRCDHSIRGGFAKTISTGRSWVLGPVAAGASGAPCPDCNKTNPADPDDVPAMPGGFIPDLS